MHGSLSSRVGCWWLYPLTALLLAGASWPTGGAGAQQTGPPDRQRPTPTFKVDINFVEIPVVVVDRQGRFVTGLRQSDFAIYEDGERQTVAAFRAVNLDVARPEAPPFFQAAVQPDVQTNATPFDGRIYVLLMDDLHVDAVHTAPAREVAKRLVDTQIGAGDLAAIIYTSGRAGTSQDFTADRRLLVAAIDRFVGRRLDSVAQAPSVLPGRETSGGLSGGESRLNRQVTLSAIRAISNALAAIPGRRKALVLFSEGFSLPDQVGEAQIEFADAVSAAVRANVSIYGVDPAGLKLAGGRADITPDIRGDPFSTGFQAIEAESRGRLETLRRLSLDTGGLAAINTNILEPALDRIGQDNSRYYLLGYYPATSKRDGKFHRVEIKVGMPDVEVRARPGYVALRGSASTPPADARPTPGERSLPAAVRETLDYPLPVPGLRLAVGAVPFRGKGSNGLVTIVVEVDGRDVRFTEAGGRWEAGLALAIFATDSEGRTRNSLTRTIGLPLGARRHTEIAIHGLRVVERLDLPHGRYRLRIAVQDVESQRVGSVHYDVEVPNFGALPLAISGLILTSSVAGTVPSAPGQHIDTLRRVLPGPPTVARVFHNSEVLGVMAQVYDRDTAPHTVDIVATVTNSEGLEVFRREDRRSSTDSSVREGVYPYVTMVPLAGLAPGPYVLAVEARSGLKPERSVRRAVPFEIAIPAQTDEKELS